MIQRPRNKQRRTQQQKVKTPRGDGRGGGQSHDAIPNVQQIVTGVHVSIVLKIDQSTGRQVQGTVAEVLTSGNHPRGIKVKLVDGRVGRVQRLATEEEARTGSAGLRNLGRNGEGSGTSARQFGYREEASIIPPTGFTLADYFPQDPIMAQSSGQLPYPTLFACPICFEFEGDELALTHHVNSHLD
ncbi:hypothetical protein D9757_002447 [Collybiopsis confluens]|uniref:YwbE n=1 Tax=Collybiopsis confluens TaxID=2823264 RepID=A0A8H5HY83_9AGAR|nr:hypothetical protein D9757_002447 [Collybiopsis confluens]